MLTRKSKIDASSATGIVIWLAIQLAALGICAARAAFWVRAPRATEQLALAIMLAAQVGTSALIFPHLLGTRGATILAVGSAWPLAQLAAEMSDASWGVLIRSEIYVWIWLISLHLWTRALPSPGARLLGTAIAGMLSLGGPLLWYCRMEFSNDGPPLGFFSPSAFGPLTGAVSQTFDRFNSGSWIELGVVSLCGAIAFTVSSRIFRFQQVIH